MAEQYQKQSEDKFDCKIEVCRIRIFCAQYRLSGTVSEIRSADKLLQAWSKELITCSECQFKVQFEDGLELTGSFLINPNGRAALGRYLRFGIARLASTQCDSRNVSMLHALRLSRAIPGDQLRNYDFD